MSLQCELTKTRSSDFFQMDPRPPSRKFPSIVLCNPPQVTANSWCIMNHAGEELASKSAMLKQEIASLTKIMTAYTAIQIVEELGLDVEKIEIVVPRIATFLGGTTAGLHKNDVFTLEELLYAMMLPSGNDAALTIAMHLGHLLRAQRKVRQQSFTLIDTIQGFHDEEGNTDLQRFVRHMNDNALKLGMRDSQFSNPHGLASKANKSTAMDLCKLSQAYFKCPILSKICDTKHFSCRNYTWHNTNQLLNYENYHGLKTGLTPTAGACLSVVYKSNVGYLFLVLIGALDQQRRFDETDRIINWVNREYSMKYKECRTSQTKNRNFIIR